MSRALHRTHVRTAVLAGVVLVIMAILFWPDLAWADNCSSPSDCEETAGYNAVLSLTGAVAAVMAGVLGSSMGTGVAVTSPTGGGTSPVPARKDDDTGPSGSQPGGDYTELPPGSDGWVVTDSDGKDHIFETEEEANRYFDHLNRLDEIEAERERISQMENEHRNLAEQVGFLNSVIQGLENSGRDATEQKRDRDRYIRERDEMRDKVNRAGGNSDYQVQDRSPFKFDQHDALLAEQKDSKRRMDTIHRMDDAINRMRDRGMIGENPNLTNKMLAQIEKMSDRMADKDAKDPTWEEIKQLQGILQMDMDATTARNESNDSNWVKEGAQATSREVFTGIDSEGKTSYAAMGLRGLTAAATLGQSEIPMEVAEKMYGIHDDVMEGKSGLDAYGNAIKRVLGDELIGRGVDNTLSLGGKVGGELWERGLKDTDIGGKLQRGARSANDFLHQDVKGLLSGSGDNVADGLGPRVPRSAADPNVRAGAEPDVTHGGRNYDQRQADFNEGRANGTRKVNELEEALANRRANPNDPAAHTQVRDAVDRVQADKHAMQDLNSRRKINGQPDPMIENFNRDLGESYDRAHANARDRLGKEFNVPPQDVKVVRATNAPGDGCGADPRGYATRPSDSVNTNPDTFDYTHRQQRPIEVKSNNASFDQDVTYRIEKDTVIDPRTGEVGSGGVDVPKADGQRVYNEEFYRDRHGGDLPRNADGSIDSDAVKRYADDMDQAYADRLDSEAYGTGDSDLKTACDPEYRGDDFSDVDAVGNTLEHKNTEWQNRAADTRGRANDMDARANQLEADGKFDEAAQTRSDAAELHQAAEGQVEEGYRQLTKQYDNLIEARADAINQRAGRTVIEVPPKLTEAINIMKDPNLSPAGVERELARLGTTPNQVAQQMSSNLEAMQKFTPRDGFDFGQAASDFTHGASRSGSH